MDEGWQEWWAERAAILEYDAGMRRDHAEAMAQKLVSHAMWAAAQAKPHSPQAPLPQAGEGGNGPSLKDSTAKREAIAAMKNALRR